jgi:hypothetical protein
MQSDRSSGDGSTGRAQRDVASLKPPHSAECVALPDGTFAVRWLMSTTWEAWRVLTADKARCERIAWDLSADEIRGRRVA